MTTKTTTEESGFLPEGYKEPQGNYMKFQKGENTFRILSSALTGYEYWNTDNKPVRSKENWKSIPEDIKLNESTGKPTAIKHFWVFVVFNVENEMVQVLELTQKSIMTAMKAYIGNKKWGDPKKYDFTVTKTGDNLETKYVVMANPHSDAPKVDFNIDLEALFDGGDPFVTAE